ncbi:MAG: tRNA pseudouridine(54/55) synthase Pus10 [Candidatus Lokiarchaeota archaeon]
MLQSTHLCNYCLGRMFSLLATATTNKDRGDSLLLSLTMENHQLYFSGDNDSRERAIHNLRLLAEKANFLPAQEVLNKEGFTFSEELSKKYCFLCNGIFKNMDNYADKAIEMVKDLEFNSFLVGTTPDAAIINKEDKFKAENTLLQAESLKSHLNREVGKRISENLKKDVDFEIPDITIIFSFDYETFNINLVIRSLFIYGRYKKLIRGIPQTRWPCGKCGGKGCEECNFTGKQYTTSVEELVTPLFLEAAKAKESKFHGAGREDIDVRMIGTGRPFILELLDPKKRNLDLDNLKKEVNEINRGKIELSDLRFSEKEEVIRIKENAEFSKKTYKALVEGYKFKIIRIHY